MYLLQKVWTLALSSMILISFFLRTRCERALGWQSSTSLLLPSSAFVMGVSTTGSVVILWKFADLWNWTKGGIHWLISQYSWNISPVIIHDSMKSSNFLKKMCPWTFPFLASDFEALYCWIYSVLKRNCCSLRLVTKGVHTVTSWSRLAIDSWHNVLGNSPCSRLHYFCFLALSFLQLWVLSRSSSSLMRSVGWKYSQCNALPSTKAWPIAAWNAPLRFVLNLVVPCESCSCESRY